MTVFLFGIGVILVAVSGRLVARAIAVPRLQLKLHLRAIGDYGFDSAPSAEVPTSRARFNEAIAQLATRFGRFAMARVPALSPLGRGQLTAAGFYDITPEAVHGYRAMAGISLPTLFIFYKVAGGGGFSIMTLLLVVGAAAAGWGLPAVAIKQRGDKRLADIDRQLPELIDLLIATVEAGMGFAASIGLVATRFQGALGDELRLTLKQQSLGISTSEALEDMVERCDTPSIRTFVRTITRGESLGGSVGPILRELATDMRRRRRQAANEKMQKAPVKMLFPLMAFIFPALMIQLLFPAIYSVMHAGL